MKNVNGTPTSPHYGGEHAKVRPFAQDQIIPAIATALAAVAILVVLFLFGKSHVATPAVVSDDSTAQKKTASTEVKTDEEGNVVLPSNTKDYDVDSTVIIQGDRAMEIFTASKKWLTRYGQDINTFAGAVPNAHIYVLLAPTSVEFYGPDDYRTPSQSFARAAEYAYTPLTASNVTTINCRDNIAKHVDEYIYLRTDHHWTGRGAYYAYQVFCKKAGLTAPKLSEYKTGKVDGFVGSLYTITQEEVLKKNPDYVQYYFPLTASKGEAFETAALTNPRSVKVVQPKVPAEYAYLCYIEGDNPIIRFTTENKNGKSILMVKESYGNAFAPFLTDNYETVYVVDPRKVDLKLIDFVNQHGIDDVLFLNYAFAPSNPTYRTAFEKMLGVTHE